MEELVPLRGVRRRDREAAEAENLVALVEGRAQFLRVVLVARLTEHLHLRDTRDTTACFTYTLRSFTLLG